MKHPLAFICLLMLVTACDKISQSVGGFDDCLLSNMKGVTASHVIDAVKAACKQKYPKEFDFTEIARSANVTRSWPEVVALEEFSSKTDDIKEEIKWQYFDDVIQPRVHPDYIVEARTQFESYSRKIVKELNSSSAAKRSASTPEAGSSPSLTETKTAAADGNAKPIAGDSHFQRLSLKEGISIEVPSHWDMHSEAEKKNFSASGEGVARAAGIDYDTTESKSRLLAVSALPIPSGAKIRVNVIRPLTFSEGDLRAATAQEMKDIKEDISTQMAKEMTVMGAKLLSVEMPRVESINGTAAILFQYRRTDSRGPSPWTVSLYRIPVKDKLIELTLSFRESDGTVWKPILDYAKQSLRF